MDPLRELATVARTIVAKKVKRGDVDFDAFMAGLYLVTYEAQHKTEDLTRLAVKSWGGNMPYQGIKELPEPLKSKLPTHAQAIYVAAFNSAWKQYEGDEKRCHATAWAAVKRKYEQKDGKWVEKADSVSKDVQFLSKDTKKQVAVGVVYEPYVVDTQGDWATPDEIEKACHQYMEAYRKTGLRHDGQSRDDIVILENYIAPQDMTVGEQAVKKGAWVMGIKVKDAETWREIESGELTGLSLYGRAHRIEMEPGGDSGQTT